MKNVLFPVLTLSLASLLGANPAAAAFDAGAAEYCYYPRASSSAEELANEALCLVGAISVYFNLDQQARYLMPIKKAAGRLKAVSYARGDYSYILRTRLLALRSSLRAARGFAESRMEIEAVFDLMVEVITLEERLTAAME